MPVTLDDVRAAEKLLEGVAVRTPVEPSRALSSLIGRPVVLKCENLQRAGSFKIRGAYVRIARLTATRERQASSPRAPATTRRASRSPLRCSAPRRRCSCRRARRCPRSAPPVTTAPRIQLHRPHRRVRAGRGARVRGADRRRAHPPVRPPRHRRRAGDDRPRDPRAVPEVDDASSCPSAAAGSSRDLALAERALRPASRGRRAGRGARRLPGSLAAGTPVGRWRNDDGRRHRGRSARATSRSTRSREYVDRGRDGLGGVDEPARCSCCSSARSCVVEPAGAAGCRGPDGASGRFAERRSRRHRPRRAATSTRSCSWT